MCPPGVARVAVQNRNEIYYLYLAFVSPADPFHGFRFFFSAARSKMNHKVSNLCIIGSNFVLLPCVLQSRYSSAKRTKGSEVQPLYKVVTLSGYFFLLLFGYPVSYSVCKKKKKIWKMNSLWRQCTFLTFLSHFFYFFFVNFN